MQLSDMRQCVYVCVCVHSERCMQHTMLPHAMQTSTACIRSPFAFAAVFQLPIIEHRSQPN